MPKVKLEPQPDCKPLGCIDNVKALVEVKGGSSVFGYCTDSECKNLMEWQPHVVWKKPDGKMVDPTPRLLPHQDKDYFIAQLEGEIEFQPDQRVKEKWERFGKTPPMHYTAKHPRFRNIASLLTQSEQAYWDGYMEIGHRLTEQVNQMAHRHHLHFNLRDRMPRGF